MEQCAQNDEWQRNANDLHTFLIRDERDLLGRV
jgi:hypothetical protein